MKWAIKIMKVGFLTFLGGIILCALVLILSKEPISNQFGFLTWVLIITLILACLNILFVFLLYFTVHFLRNGIKESLFSLKYLLLEIPLLYILYSLPIYSIKDSYWIQLLTPFAVLYILSLFVISIISHRHDVD
ncbi:MAG: hypothetical protein H6Q15_2324 [Bacteroidetes bacterium]|nr:hypothetical protein [Bacteroidota bacterium]